MSRRIWRVVAFIAIIAFVFSAIGGSLAGVLICGLICGLAIGMHRLHKLYDPPAVSIPESRSIGRDTRSIPQNVKIAVASRDGGRCRICGSTEDLQFDHIYPWSKGGSSHDPNNIQLLCGYHNRLKSNKTIVPGSLIRP